MGDTPEGNDWSVDRLASRPDPRETAMSELDSRSRTPLRYPRRSGREEAVRRLVREELEPLVDVTTDPMGSLIATRRGDGDLA